MTQLLALCHRHQISQSLRDGFESNTLHAYKYGVINMLNFRRIYEVKNTTVAINLIFYNIEDQDSWAYKKTLFTLRCWSYTISTKRIDEIFQQWKNLETKINRFTRYDEKGYKFSSFPLTNDDRELTVNTVESLLRFDKMDLGFSSFKWNDSFYNLMRIEKMMDFEITYHKNDRTWSCYLFFDGLDL